MSETSSVITWDIPTDARVGRCPYCKRVVYWVPGPDCEVVVNGDGKCHRKQGACVE